MHLRKTLTAYDAQFEWPRVQDRILMNREAKAMMYFDARSSKIGNKRTGCDSAIVTLYRGMTYGRLWHTA